MEDEMTEWVVNGVDLKKVYVMGEVEVPDSGASLEG